MKCTVRGLPVTVDFTVGEPGEPGRLWGPADGCYEPVLPEISIEGVQVGGIEVGPLLSDEILEELKDQIMTLGGHHGRFNARIEFG